MLSSILTWVMYLSLYLIIGHTIGMIMYTLGEFFQGGWRKNAPRNDEEWAMYTFLWPLVFPLCFVGSLRNTIKDWIDVQAEKYHERKKSKHQVNPNIVDNFHV